MPSTSVEVSCSSGVRSDSQLTLSMITEVFIEEQGFALEDEIDEFVSISFPLAETNR